MESFSLPINFGWFLAHKSPGLLVRIAVAILVPLTAVFIYRLFFHPLAGVPGPLFARVTGLWRTSRYFGMTWHDDVIELHEKYGPLVRIAPDELSVVDAAAMKELYSHGHNAKKSKWYDTWASGAPAPIVFSERNHKLHAALRKRVSAAYTMTSILKYEPYIQSCMDLCFIKFKKYADLGQPIDMAEWAQALAFDVVGELTFGTKLGHLETESDVDNLRKTNTSDIYWTGNFGNFWGQSYLFQNAFTFWFASVTGVGSAAMTFLDWGLQRINARKEDRDNTEREDMLSHFLKMKPLEGAEKLLDIEVLVETLNVIGAGADTVSVAMRSCLYYICKNPKVYKKLQQEIDDYYEKNHLSQPISYKQTSTLPYLKAVIAEATRILPSILYQLPREAPAGGMRVDGHFVPAGTTIGISPIAQNRDKKIWGDDANEFRPERWLEDPDKVSFYESHNMTFGGNGPRSCIGRNLALVELQKFIAQGLRHFSFEIANEEKPWVIKTAWFADQTEFFLRIKSRNALL